MSQDPSSTPYTPTPAPAEDRDAHVQEATELLDLEAKLKERGFAIQPENDVIVMHPRRPRLDSEQGPAETTSESLED